MTGDFVRSEWKIIKFVYPNIQCRLDCNVINTFAEILLLNANNNQGFCYRMQIARKFPCIYLFYATLHELLL